MIGGGMNTRSTIGFGGAATGGDVLVFAARELGGFLNADDVVFKTKVAINVLLALVMAENDLRAVGEDEQAARDVELMREPLEETATEGFEVFAVGLADLAEEQAFESRDALAIVGAELGEEPVGFTAAARRRKLQPWVRRGDRTGGRQRWQQAGGPAE